MDASDFASYQSLIQQTTQANNEWSAAQAQRQMDFQERMSSTAHQREVADLKAAGLNPVLSAGGNGASSPSGAMAETDHSGTSAIFGLLEKMIDTENAKANAEMSVVSRASGALSGDSTNARSVSTGSPFLDSVNQMIFGSDGKIDSSDVNKVWKKVTGKYPNSRQSAAISGAVAAINSARSYHDSNPDRNYVMGNVARSQLNDPVGTLVAQRQYLNNIVSRARNLFKRK